MEKPIAYSIDDSKVNLMLLEEYSEDLDIEVISFLDPIQALPIALKTPPDIIFIDYMMPKMNGIEFIEQFRRVDAKTPIIMITAVSDNPEVKIAALRAGATEFLGKPIDPVEFIVRANNLLTLRKSQKLVENKASLLEDEVMKATFMLKEAESETLLMLAKTSEMKDPETGDHIARVASYSRLLAKGYGMDEYYCDLIYHSAPLHDLGKVGIPDAILLKPGKLDDDEFLEMKKHTIIGHKILKDTHSKYLQSGMEIAISHHERYDGRGYPYGILGQDIPLAGRIVAIADVFDALVSERPYKKAWSIDEACAQLIRDSGMHFDPDLVDIFISERDEVESIYGRNAQHHNYNR
jgi:putative two-component system response regulator